MTLLEKIKNFFTKQIDRRYERFSLSDSNKTIHSVFVYKGVEYENSMLNISKGGCAINMLPNLESELVLNTNFSFQIVLFLNTDVEVKETLSLTGKVVYRNSFIGVQFVDVVPSEMEKLDRILAPAFQAKTLTKISDDNPVWFHGILNADLIIWLESNEIVKFDFSFSDKVVEYNTKKLSTGKVIKYDMKNLSTGVFRTTEKGVIKNGVDVSFDDEININTILEMVNLIKLTDGVEQVLKDKILHVLETVKK
jgi:hypothetical protein